MKVYSAIRRESLGDQVYSQGGGEGVSLGGGAFIVLWLWGHVCFHGSSSWPSPCSLSVNPECLSFLWPVRFHATIKITPDHTLCPLQSCNLGSLAAYFYCWIRLCYLPLFRHVSFLRPRPRLLFISCPFRALGPVLDTKEILRLISLEVTVTEGGGDRRDGRFSTCRPRPVGDGGGLDRGLVERTF